MCIFIFKTNIESSEDVETLTTILNNNPKIIKWHIDREDVDNVLRIEATANYLAELIANALRATGFKCEELPD